MKTRSPYVTRTYNLKEETVKRIEEISSSNHNILFQEVVDWAIEQLHISLFGKPSDEPIPEREELDRR